MFGKLAEAIDGDPDLSASEKLQLKEQLRAAATEELSPEQEANLFRRIKDKIAQSTWNFFVPVLQNVLTEYAKRQLGL